MKAVSLEAGGEESSTTVCACEVNEPKRSACLAPTPKADKLNHSLLIPVRLPVTPLEREGKLLLGIRITLIQKGKDSEVVAISDLMRHRKAGQRREVGLRRDSSDNILA